MSDINEAIGKAKCSMCGDREWIVLQQHPLERELEDLVAPCLGCSGTKNVREIEKRRCIKLERNSKNEWVEVPVN